MTISSPSLYSFTGQSAADPTLQAGMQQYVQQGAVPVNIAAANPVASSGQYNLGKSLGLAAQQPRLAAQLSPQQIQQGLNGGATMGQPGPTPQALALAQNLAPQPMPNQINPATGQATPQAFMAGGQ